MYAIILIITTLRSNFHSIKSKINADDVYVKCIVFSRGTFSFNTPTHGICAFRQIHMALTTTNEVSLYNKILLCIKHAYFWEVSWVLSAFCLCCVLPVWASASSKRGYFKTVLWHDSCVYVLVLLFPIICFMFPPSFLSLCFQPQLYHWLIAAIKTGFLLEWEEGLLSHFPSHSFSFHSLCPSFIHHYIFFLFLHC